MVKDAGRFVVMTDGDTFTARSVIVATGAYHRAYIPAFASDFLPSLVQRHSSEYRNPGALPSGSVLVVGAGNSGAQIALELAESGRSTWLSGRDTGSIPRRLLGRDVRLAVVDGDAPIHRLVGGSQTDGRRAVHRRSAGRLLAPRPHNSHADNRRPDSGRVERAPRLDDGRVLEDVRTVVWCTGFRPDFRWIQLPVFGPEGYPHHRRGIVAGAPGLGFVGLRYRQDRLVAARRCARGCEYVVRQLSSHD